MKFTALSLLWLILEVSKLVCKKWKKQSICFLIHQEDVHSNKELGDEIIEHSHFTNAMDGWFIVSPPLPKLPWWRPWFCCFLSGLLMTWKENLFFAHIHSKSRCQQQSRSDSWSFSHRLWNCSRDNTRCNTWNKMW